MAIGTIAAVVGATAAAAGTAYTIKTTEDQKKKVKKAEQQARAETEKTITERKNKIQGMKTRLFANDNSIFGNEVEDNQITGA